MTRAEWTLSVGFVAFFVAKIAEIAFAIEQWPLSPVAMFSTYVAGSVAPVRVDVSARFGAARTPLAPSDLGLTSDELQGTVLGLPECVGPQRIAAAWHARHPDAPAIDAIEIVFEPLRRPGGTGRLDRHVLVCPFGAWGLGP